MPETTYITVIVPVRLGWEPTYSTDDETIEPGVRVKVKLMNKEYVAVVSAVGVEPDIDKERILPVISVEKSLEKVSPEEIEFWRFLSSYYMCSPGEVFKMAYPAGLTSAELKRSNIHLALPDNPRPEYPLENEEQSTIMSIHQAFSSGKPVLLEGALPSDRDRLSARLASEALAKGESVLWLMPFPENVSSAQKVLKPVFGDSLLSYTHSTTLSKRREICKLVRSAENPALIIGTKSALFLPWRKLGLVIVSEEQEPSYKNNSSSPRYNARDAAIVLSKIHSASALLCAGVPSLESFYNCKSGRYVCVRVSRKAALSQMQVIDTSAEFRKKGMIMDLSFKLRDAACKVLSEGSKVLFVDALPMGEDFKEKVLPAFSAKETEKLLFADINSFRRFKLDDVGLIALLRGELLCSRQDFRADEKALHKLVELSSLGPMLLVQTERSAHPVFRLSAEALMEQLLEERSIALLPPLSRQIDILVEDTNGQRSLKLSKLLFSKLSSSFENLVGPLNKVSQEGHDCSYIRLTLPKDASLAAKKEQLKHMIEEFEREYKYLGHILPDVDPR